MNSDRLAGASLVWLACILRPVVGMVAQQVAAVPVAAQLVESVADCQGLIVQALQRHHCVPEGSVSALAPPWWLQTRMQE